MMSAHSHVSLSNVSFSGGISALVSGRNVTITHTTYFFFIIFAEYSNMYM